MAIVVDSHDFPNGARVIALVSAAHFFSHFYMLLLPPLFPLLRDAYGVGYTELGLSITVFSLASGLTQAPIGFLVDRYGAARLLLAGLFVESLAFLLVGVVPSYGALMILMVAAGLANAVYHPADYAILNYGTIHKKMLGKAFSIHTFSGYLGSAVAPVMVLALLPFFGWQAALIICGLCGIAVTVVLALNRDVLREPNATRMSQPAAGDAGIRLLLSPPILMGLVFFVGLSMASYGFGNFGVATLDALYAMPLEQTGAVLSAYLFAAPVGVLAGGWLADRMQSHHWITAGCLCVIALSVVIAATFSLHSGELALLFLIAGFSSGVVAPSRDMMIRAVTPPGQTGKVFGFVSTGFNIGGIAAPLLFGYLLDNHGPRWVFWALTAISLLTIATVMKAASTSHAAANTGNP